MGDYGEELSQLWRKQSPQLTSQLTPFHKACAELNDVAINTFLDQRQEKLDSPIPNAEFYKFTPLHLIVHQANPAAQPRVKLIKLLTQVVGNINARDVYGNTPLHLAALNRSSRSAALEILMSMGADTTLQNRFQKTPIDVLCECLPMVDELGLLIQNCTNTFHITQEGYIARLCLKYEIRMSFAEKYLYDTLNTKTDLMNLDPMGRSVIQNIVSGHCLFEPEYMDKLILQEEPRRRRRVIPLYYSILERFIEKGFLINHQDNLGRTALHSAAFFCNEAATQALIALGADINIVNAAGKTPFECAIVRLKSDNECLRNDAKQICQMYIQHIKGLEAIGLYVCKQNDLALNVLAPSYPGILVENMSSEFLEQLKCSSNIKMFKNGFTVRQFLCDTGAVNRYARLPFAQRRQIYKYCQHDYGEIHLLKDFIYMQYENAKEREFLLSPALESLEQLTKFRLPYLCTDVIFSYLTNLELKNLKAACK